MQRFELYNPSYGSVHMAPADKGKWVPYDNHVAEMSLLRDHLNLTQKLLESAQQQLNTLGKIATEALHQ